MSKLNAGSYLHNPEPGHSDDSILDKTERSGGFDSQDSGPWVKIVAVIEKSLIAISSFCAGLSMCTPQYHSFELHMDQRTDAVPRIVEPDKTALDAAVAGAVARSSR